MCPAVERIDLTKAGNLCSESSSMVGMTCQVTMIVAITLAITGVLYNSSHNTDHNCGHVQSAWDTETVTRTVWHPGTSGEGASTTMYSQHRLVIHRVTVTQYQVSRHNLAPSIPSSVHQ